SCKMQIVNGIAIDDHLKIQLMWYNDHEFQFSSKLPLRSWELHVIPPPFQPTRLKCYFYHHTKVWAYSFEYQQNTIMYIIKYWQYPIIRLDHIRPLTMVSVSRHRFGRKKKLNKMIQSQEAIEL